MRARMCKLTALGKQSLKAMVRSWRILCSFHPLLPAQQRACQDLVGWAAGQVATLLRSGGRWLRGGEGGAAAMQSHRYVTPWLPAAAPPSMAAHATCGSPALCGTPHLFLLPRLPQPPLARRLARRRTAVPRATRRLGAAAPPQLVLVLQPQRDVARVVVLWGTGRSAGGLLIPEAVVGVTGAAGSGAAEQPWPAALPVLG